ncbi:MAG: hypothetical protein IT439_08685 [Phycisphaerales bacterium]|nr:hypothetical protein [Phycisphaerales bacterium]
MKKFITMSALGLVLLSGAGFTTAASAAASREGVQRGDETRLIARARTRGVAMHAKGDYRERGSRRRLNVEVRLGTPGDVFDVAVNGAVIGQVTINALGLGKIEMNTNDGANPPFVASGDVLTVGPVSGLFIAR